jgi:hypothetical protein
MFKFSQQHITVFRNKRYFESSMLIAYFLVKASIAHILKTVNEDTINKIKINDIPRHVKTHFILINGIEIANSSKKSINKCATPKMLNTKSSITNVQLKTSSSY